MRSELYTGDAVAQSGGELQATDLYLFRSVGQAFFPILWNSLVLGCGNHRSHAYCEPGEPVAVPAEVHTWPTSD
jgi:hypothetical protein